MPKHRSITHTIIPPEYTRPDCFKQQTDGFNKWVKYVREEVKKINQTK